VSGATNTCMGHAWLSKGAGQGACVADRARCVWGITARHLMQDAEGATGGRTLSKNQNRDAHPRATLQGPQPGRRQRRRAALVHAPALLQPRARSAHHNRHAFPRATLQGPQPGRRQRGCAALARAAAPPNLARREDSCRHPLCGRVRAGHAAAPPPGAAQGVAAAHRRRHAAATAGAGAG